MDRRFVTLALAGSLASALAAAATPVFADDGPTRDKCYGVALKGQNDCAAGQHDCAGKQAIDYDGASFKLVPAGTCTTIQTPSGYGMLMPKA